MRLSLKGVRAPAHTPWRKEPKRIGVSVSGSSARGKSKAIAWAGQKGDVQTTTTSKRRQSGSDGNANGGENGKSSSISPYTILRMVKAEKNPKWALRVFKRACTAPGYRPILPLYDKLIEKLGRGKLFAEMAEILEQMKLESCKCTEGFIINVIKIYGLARIPQQALKIFYEMEDFNCQWSIRSFNTLLSALFRSNRLDMAGALYDDIGNFGIRPDVCTYNILIKAKCEDGQMDAASKLFDEMQKRGSTCRPNVVTYTTLMRGFCQQGKLERVIGLVDDMGRKGCVPDVVVYNTLMYGLCKHGNLRHAIEVKNEMAAKGCEPDVISYNILINAFCESGNFREANSLFHQMAQKGHKPNIVTHNALLKGLCKEGKVYEAAKMFPQMLFEGCLPNSETHEILIHAFCTENGMSLEAKKFLDAMLRERMNPSMETCNTLIKALCKEGNVFDATKALGQVKVKTGFDLGDFAWMKIVNYFCNKKTSQDDGNLHILSTILEEKNLAAFQKPLSVRFSAIW